MVYLRECEARVIEYLRAGKGMQEISKEMDVSRDTTKTRISTFLARGWIERVSKGVYKILIEYQVREKVSHSKTLQKHERVTSKKSVERKFFDHIPVEIQTYLYAHYKTHTRTQLRKALNIPRYVLNNYLIEMGLGGK